MNPYETLSEETKNKVDIEAYNTSVRIKTLGMQFALDYFYKDYKKHMTEKETLEDKKVCIMLASSVLYKTKEFLEEPSQEDKQIFNECVRTLINDLKELNLQNDKD